MEPTAFLSLRAPPQPMTSKRVKPGRAVKPQAPAASEGAEPQSKAQVGPLELGNRSSSGPLSTAGFYSDMKQMQHEWFVRVAQVLELAVPEQASFGLFRNDSMTREPHLRLLFLDFDGVLHPCLSEQDKAVEHMCWLHVLEDHLLAHPDVRIVVHSTWRYDHTDAELRSLLQGLGSRFVGSAPRGPREQVIETVLQANKGRVKDHLVLDDDGHAFRDSPLNVLILNPLTGLSSLDAQLTLEAWLISGTLQRRAPL